MPAQNKELILGGVVLVAATSFMFWILSNFIDVSSIDSSVKASIVAGIVALFSLIATYLKERSRAIKEAHRDKKVEVYSIFFDIIFFLLRKTKSGEPLNREGNADFQTQWSDLSKGVMFYGSPEVVRAFGQFTLENDTEVARSAERIMRKIGRILLAMRKDIGLSNWGLDELTIHQVYVNENVHNIGKL